MSAIINFRQKLTELSQYSSRIRLYPGTTMQFILRSEGHLPGSIVPELKDLYTFTNGASLLDYCLMGCKNRTLPDLAENTLSLWGLNHDLAGDFVGFIGTSSCQNFGYLLSISAPTGSHPVACFDHEEDRLLVISSSVGKFLEIFLDELEDTVKNYPDPLYIVKENWPYDLGEWLRRDPELITLYKSGVLSRYYSTSPELQRYIETLLCKF